MKTLKIFLRDLKVNLREFLSLWIMLIPIALAAIITIATPGATDSFLSVAMLEDAPPEQAAFYEKYASVERFGSVAQVERRVMGRDFCFGLLPEGTGGFYILARGDEPQSVLDAMKLLKTCEEKGESPTFSAAFASLGRTTLPLKSTLITGLLILVSILSGMLISLIIFEAIASGIHALFGKLPSSIFFVFKINLVNYIENSIPVFCELQV